MNSEQKWSAAQRPEQSSSAIGSSATTGQLVYIHMHRWLSSSPGVEPCSDKLEHLRMLRLQPPSAVLPRSCRLILSIFSPVAICPALAPLPHPRPTRLVVSPTAHTREPPPDVAHRPFVPRSGTPSPPLKGPSGCYWLGPGPKSKTSAPRPSGSPLSARDPCAPLALA